MNDSSGTPSSGAWQPVTGRAAPAKGDTAVKSSLIGTTTSPGGTKDIKGQGHQENGATSYLVSPKGKAITGTAK